MERPLQLMEVKKASSVNTTKGYHTVYCIEIDGCVEQEAKLDVGGQLPSPPHPGVRVGCPATVDIA